MTTVNHALRSLAAITITILSLATLLACNMGTQEEPANGTAADSSLDAEVSPELAVLAHRLVFAYMSDKAWGFFGGTCDQWLEMDYQWTTSQSEQLPDGRIKITYTRQADRLLGPDALIFYVNIDSGEVQGDNVSETGRSGIAEGCDQW